MKNIKTFALLLALLSLNNYTAMGSVLTGSYGAQLPQIARKTKDFDLIEHFKKTITKKFKPVLIAVFKKNPIGAQDTFDGFLENLQDNCQE